MAEGQLTHARVTTLTQIGTVTKYNFLNYFRARRFYVMFAIIAIISGLITGLVAYFQPASFLGFGALAFYGAGWGTFATFVIVLSAAFFGGDAISGEFQNRTGYYLVPNPIRRSAIYVGKYLAALAASTIILGIFALVMILNGLYYFPGSLPWEFEQSILFSWVYLIAALSLTFAFSSLFKSSSISILMSVILLLFVFNVVDEVAVIVANVEPWFSITYGAGIVANILTVPYPEHYNPNTLGTGTGPGSRLRIPAYNATVTEGLVILAIYFFVMAVVGLWLFQHKEFTS
jgi:ABC-2 type transport system permease protein